MNTRLFSLIASTFAVGLLLKFGAPLLPVMPGSRCRRRVSVQGGTQVERVELIASN